MTPAVVGLVGLVVGLGAGAVAWMAGDHGDSSPVVGRAVTSTTAGAHASPHSGGVGTAGTSLDERTFLQEMVPHHESAVAAAQLALVKSQHPAVRRLARDIVRSQKAEIAQMKAWHREWYGSPLQPSSTAALMGMDMSWLEAASGDAFDRVFLATMLPHHASAVTMADSVRMSGPRQQVVQLADEIIAAQATEIGRMQQWRERWYPPLG